MKRLPLVLALIGAAGAAHAQPQQIGQAMDGATKQRPSSVISGAQPPSVTGQPAMQGQTFKDEYGFRYDDKGNRIDGRGNIISPQTRTR
jgi:hypothetical protein